MSAQELLDLLYKGEEHEPKCQVIGHKSKTEMDMICDCDPDGECCGY